jgi:hypothetical protein
VRARIEKALKDMRREHAQIAISSVSRRAKVTRTNIHRRDDLVALIRAHRPLAAVDADTAAPAAGTETSIIAVLWSRLTAEDTQIAELQGHRARSRPHHRGPAWPTRQTPRHHQLSEGCPALSMLCMCC